MTNKKRYILAGFVALALVAADQLSKAWAVSALSGGHKLQILGDYLSFVLVYNSGAAFSLGGSATWIFTLIAAAACIGIPFFFIRSRSWGTQLSLTSVWAGALGNLIDRLVQEPGFGQGRVVDFISYGGAFVGNVADIELVVGVCALIIVEFMAEKKRIYD